MRPLKYCRTLFHRTRLKVLHGGALHSRLEVTAVSWRTETSGVRVWGEGGGGSGGADGSVLVARPVAAAGGQRVGVHAAVPRWSQVDFGSRSRFGSEDGAGLVLLLQVGHVLHHVPAVGHGQLVGAVGHEVEVAGDEDDGERKHGQNDEGETHDESPGRVALEALLGQLLDPGVVPRWVDGHFDDGGGDEYDEAQRRHIGPQIKIDLTGTESKHVLKVLHEPFGAVDPGH